MHLKYDILGEMETKQTLKYLQLYFDHKANIQIYLNIKNVIILTQMLFWDTNI